MEIPYKGYVLLYNALEARGWRWEENRLYPPHKTFWVEGTHGTGVPPHTLERMYEKFKDMLERMPEIKHLYPDERFFQNWVEDTESIVNVLEVLVNEIQSGG